MNTQPLAEYAAALDRAEDYANSDPNLKLVRASWLVASVCRERTREGDRARALVMLGRLEDFLAREDGPFSAVSRNAASRICAQIATEIATSA
jgi:hypothetical protein